MKTLNLKFPLLFCLVLVVSMCVPPKDKSGTDFAKEKARLDSLRGVRCPRLMSSAAEYYRNRDWKQTIRVYSQITDLSCDEWNVIYAPPEEIYQYYSFAYTQIGRFDSAEFVLLDGLQKIPQNVQLRKQLALINNPIVGDKKYILSNKKIKSDKDLMLHAYSLKFYIDNKKFFYKANPPAAFNKYLNKKKLNILNF